MPFSDLEGKDVILGWVKKINPKIAILDVGAGAGTYSDLLRDHVKIDMIDAMEVWEPYIKEFSLEEKYNFIWNHDVRTVSDLYPYALNAWDIVIFGDVLEHMTKDEAKKVVLNYARGIGTNNIIISFPVLHLEQGPYEGNPYEIHVDHWSYDEMLEFCRENGIPVVESGHGETLAWFWLDTRRKAC